MASSYNMMFRILGVSGSLDGIYVYHSDQEEFSKYLKDGDPGTDAWVNVNHDAKYIEVWYGAGIKKCFTASFDNLEDFNLSNVTITDSSLSGITPKMECLILDETTPAQIKVEGAGELNVNGTYENIGKLVNSYSTFYKDINGSSSYLIYFSSYTNTWRISSIYKDKSGIIEFINNSDNINSELGGSCTDYYRSVSPDIYGEYVKNEFVGTDPAPTVTDVGSDAGTDEPEEPSEPSTPTQGNAVKFVRITEDKFKTLTKDESTLYFVANKGEAVGDLYRGSMKMTYSAQIVTEWPATPLKNTLYVNTTEEISKVYNGTTWIQVGAKILTSTLVEETDWTTDDVSVPTMKAVGNYVTNAIKDVTGGAGVVTSVTQGADGKSIVVEANGASNSFTLDGLIENISYTETTGELTLSFTGEKSPIKVNLPKEQALTGVIQHTVTADEANTGIYVGTKAGDVGLLLTVSNLTDGTEVEYFVSLENFLDRYTQGDGITIDTNKVVSVKPATDSESFLVVNENGVAIKGVQDAINTATSDVKKTVDSYTVNGHKINTNPVLNGADLKVTGYTKASSQVAITTEDTVNVALGKVEKKADDALDAINALDATTVASTAAEDTTAIQGVSVVAEVTQTDGKVAMTTVKADKFGSANKALSDAKEYTDQEISKNVLAWEIYE